MKRRLKKLLFVAMVSVPIATGCSTHVDAHGSSAEVYGRTRDAVLRAGFQVEENATGTYGEQPEEGTLDVRYLERQDKFQAARFVSIEISPFGDREDRERTVSFKGWKYTWVSMITFRAYTSHQSDIQRLAADAVRKEFDQSAR
ncbi:MAG: hypothetical protein HEQ23_01310 [Tepidisphaera sp.]